MGARRKPEAGLGELEAAVMNVVWARGQATVQDVHQALARRRELAYTTVLTVLGRLADKGLLSRRRESRAFVYSPLVTRETTLRGMVRRVTSRVLEGSSADMIAHLIEHEPDIDEHELDRLEAVIRARRRRKP